MNPLKFGGNVVIGLSILFLVTLAPVARAQSTPTGKVPDTQKESDWVDGRWNQTDLGRFHSSVLPLSNGVIAKGLSVRVGEKATVVYDTETATLRGGWTGGFLKFRPGRYGLIDSPLPDGEVAFISQPAPSWGELPVRWGGLRTHGDRVVLDYTVDEVQVSESPWHGRAGEREVFVRTMEFSAHPKPLAMTLWGSGGRKFSSENREGISFSMLRKDGLVMVAATMGNSEATWVFENELVKLQLGPRSAGSSLKICWGTFVESDLPLFYSWLQASKVPEGLDALKKPGVVHWPAITTRGQRSLASEAYVIDTLTVPYENPWKALMFTSGVGFLPDGRAVVSTIHGDVWLVSGIDEALERLVWKRFATGLFQPLGLTVRDGEIFVLGRDQITRLHDQNGDGEADFYENYFNGIHTSTGGHDYVTSLEKDDAGNLYYVDPDGVHRVSADGRSKETLATGWRNPNGMGVSPDGKIITVAPQQGTWTPSSLLAEAKVGGWYGFGGPKPAPGRSLGYDLPLCWIPHRVDNSSGSQVWVTSDKWGPLQNQMLHFSFGRCSQFLVMREVVDGVAQGAITQIPGRFLSGAMRATFNPKDGQMYVAGSTGWQSSAARDGSLQRVRYTGKQTLLPIEVHAKTNGLQIKFSGPLDRTTAEDAGSFAYSHWNYRYTKEYGSADYSVTNPEKEGRDTLDIKTAKLLPDGRSVFVEIPNIRTVMQWELKYSLNAATGTASVGQVYGTIHRFPSGASNP